MPCLYRPKTLYYIDTDEYGRFVNSKIILIFFSMLFYCFHYVLTKKINN